MLELTNWLENAQAIFLYKIPGVKLLVPLLRANREELRDWKQSEPRTAAEVWQRSAGVFPDRTLDLTAITLVDEVTVVLTVSRFRIMNTRVREADAAAHTAAAMLTKLPESRIGQ